MVRLLLDTHALFWALYDDASLADAAGAAIRDPANVTYVATASAQEIALALSVGRWRAALDLLLHFEARVEGEGYGLIVPMPADYANQLRLPDVPNHNDPYDKLIIAQAIGRGMVLVTADQYAPCYPVTCIEAGRGPRQEPRGGRIVLEELLEPVGQPDLIKLAPPEYRNNQVIFQKGTDQLIVAAYDDGILVVHGWTVSIGLDDVKRYVANFARNSGRDINSGFYFSGNGFVISHQGAKLTFAPEEGTVIVRFLSDRYDIPAAIQFP